MNFLFSVILIASLTALIIISPDSALGFFISGAGKGLNFALKLFAVYAVWCSVLSLWEKMNFNRFFARKTAPFLHKIFPGEEEDVYGDLSVNLSANFLGMGSAGTPAGIRGTKNMKSAKNRSMLIVINSTSIQLIPATIVALRATYVSTTDVILPTIISTSISTLIGFFLVKILVKK